MKPDEFYTRVSRERLLAALADAPTPCYLFFASVIAQQVMELRSRLGRRFNIHYAVKANPHPAILRLMRRFGLGADVASEGELRAVLEAGFEPGDIEFSGPGKTQVELEYAIQTRIGAINVESLGELELLVHLSKRLGARPKIGLRVNPAVQGRSGLKMAGATQFGLSDKDLDHALERIRQEASVLDFVGLHLHLGSQILDIESILENFRIALQLAWRVGRRAEHPLRKINFGGGFGVTYFEGQQPLDFVAAGAGIEALLEEYFSSVDDFPKLIVEPGRYLVAESGVYVTRVLYRKHTNGKEFAIVDGGMHHNYLLAGGMGQVVRRNFYFEVLPNGGAFERVAPYELNVAGRLCTPQDLLLQNVRCSQTVRPGDYLVFFNCGAYGSTASPINFLSHPQPREVLIE
ncbi:MAG TPA: pyridoxal-dependent decarboxylase, exosortase A system-associated [Methylomirabilota bacterium]|jgi:diaminopimelate decarboxylase|nr:pyridoxal-dependent decarboxylase, exosortase A system-associated [Methylomirabilota bacterium]